MRAVLILMIVFFASAVHAENKIYKVVNADGTVSFSDTPAPGAEEVKLNASTTSMQLVPLNNQTNTAPTRPSTSFRLSILSPMPDATIRANNGDVRISAQIQPKTPGKYLLDFAGKQYTSDSGVFALKGIDRGAHTYSLKFTDNKGKVIASSDKRTLYLHQASVLIRNTNN